MLKHTSLFAAHQKLGAKLVDFGGWEMPVQYTSITDEHLAVRNAAGLFDISHMGEVTVSGPGAVAFARSVVPCWSNSSRDSTYDFSLSHRMRWSSSLYTKVSFPKPLFAITSIGERFCVSRFMRMLSVFEFAICRVCSWGAKPILRTRAITVPWPNPSTEKRPPASVRKIG